MGKGKMIALASVAGAAAIAIFLAAKKSPVASAIPVTATSQLSQTTTNPTTVASGTNLSTSTALGAMATSLNPSILTSTPNLSSYAAGPLAATLTIGVSAATAGIGVPVTISGQALTSVGTGVAYDIVYLLDQNGNPITTVTADANGNYSFDVTFSTAGISSFSAEDGNGIASPSVTITAS